MAESALFQQSIFHRIDPGIGPDIEIVTSFNDGIADAQHVARIEHKHFIGDLDIAYAVFIHEEIDLSDHGLGTPIPITVHALFQTSEFFSALKRGLYATKTTMVRTSERGIERSVGLARKVAKTVPVVRAIFVHG